MCQCLLSCQCKICGTFYSKSTYNRCHHCSILTSVFSKFSAWLRLMFLQYQLRDRYKIICYNQLQCSWTVFIKFKIVHLFKLVYKAVVVHFVECILTHISPIHSRPERCSYLGCSLLFCKQCRRSVMLFI